MHFARPAGISAMSFFFVFGMTMSGLAAISLVSPGGALEAMWQINPKGREGLGAMGLPAVVLMATVSLTCAGAAAGLWFARLWGWWLGCNNPRYQCHRRPAQRGSRQRPAHADRPPRCGGDALLPTDGACASLLRCRSTVTSLRLFLGILIEQHRCRRIRFAHHFHDALENARQCPGIRRGQLPECVREFLLCHGRWGLLLEHLAARGEGELHSARIHARTRAFDQTAVDEPSSDNGYGALIGPRLFRKLLDPHRLPNRT